MAGNTVSTVLYIDTDSGYLVDSRIEPPLPIALVVIRHSTIVDMTNKIFFSTLFLLLTVQGIAQDNYFKPKYSIILHSKKSRIILNPCSRERPPHDGFSRITKRDLSSLERNFKKIYLLEYSDFNHGNNKVRELSTYSFQYFGVLIGSKRFIYINAFLESSLISKDYPYSLNKPVIGCDGGNGYWGALFDLEQQDFVFLSINGSG